MTSYTVLGTLIPLSPGDTATDRSRICHNPGEKNAERCLPPSVPIVSPRYWLCFLSLDPLCCQVSQALEANVSVMCTVQDPLLPSYAVTPLNVSAEYGSVPVECVESAVESSALFCAHGSPNVTDVPGEVGSLRSATLYPNSTVWWLNRTDCGVPNTYGNPAFDHWMCPAVPESQQHMVAACQTSDHILAMFALVNVVTSLVGLLAGHRRVASALSCRIFGKEGSYSWAYMWLLPVALQLGGNAAVAALFRSRAGYEHLQVGQFVLLLAARPRISWLLQVWARTYYARGSNISPFQSSAQSAFIAELVLQAIAIYTMVSVLTYTKEELGGLTINYSLNPQSLYVMTAGAFLYMFWIFPLLFLGFLAACNYRNPPSKAVAGALTGSESSASEHMAGPAKITQLKVQSNESNVLALSIAFILTTYLGSWLFWAGFVQISANDFCPPDIWGQGGILSLASILGIFFGTGV